MGKRLITGCIFVCFAALTWEGFPQTNETLTVVTYYPSPYGVYRTVRTDHDGEQVIIGNDTNQPSIELFDTDGDGDNPYISFSNDATNPDMTITLDGDDLLVIDGGNLQVMGDILAGNIPGCQRFNFTAASGNMACPVGTAIPLSPLVPMKYVAGVAELATSGSFLCCQNN